ncbi:hypothetical protein [Listeria costaricensis]|uniref:hypothetical protein n=1 Tax=Listeria costaricensis TaxID=2026604 RepID=UPI000C068F5A|nr:hypothetical protein [Listeria costaricensis]
MVTWILIATIAFIVFLGGLITLFFQSKRKIGAILVTIGMLLLVVSIIGVFSSFGKLQAVNNEMIHYSAQKQASNKDSGETKSYQVAYENDADQLTKKITQIDVSTQPVYSTLDGKEVPGSVTIHLEITNHTKQTVTTYPGQGQLTTDLGTVNGGDAVLSNFDSSKVEPEKTISGTLVFPLKKIKSIDDISKVSLSWLSYEGDETEPITTDTGQITLK